MSNEIKKYEAIQPVDDGVEIVEHFENPLYITAESKGITLKDTLARLSQYVNVADIVSKVKAGTQYVVNVPLEYQSGLNSGELFLMQNAKTGKMWPSLMRIAENGRKEVVTPLPIKEQAIIQGNPLQDISQSAHNLYLQQQMAQLVQLVETTYKAVERIEHGQMDDRIGLLIAGRTQITLAMRLEDPERRQREIEMGRQNLMTAQAQIGETLKRRAAEFEAIPKSSIGQFLKELLHSGYLDERDKEFYEIQEYYDLYLQSTKLIAASYAICGELNAAESTFALAAEAMKEINYSKVKTIEFAHKDKLDLFYNHSAEYISAEVAPCLALARNYDCIALEVSGEELLEAYESDGTEREVPEGTTEQR